MAKSTRMKLAALIAAPLLLFWLLCLNWVEPGQMGLTWNPITGEIGLQKHPGIYLSSPVTFVTTLETRPQRVCLTSSAHSAPNCRLVQFDPAHYREFVAVEGWRYYWWSNRISFNSGHRETYRGFRDVLRGYAFGVQEYPFITVLKKGD